MVFTNGIYNGLSCIPNDLSLNCRIDPSLVLDPPIIGLPPHSNCFPTMQIGTLNPLGFKQGNQNLFLSIIFHPMI